MIDLVYLTYNQKKCDLFPKVVSKRKKPTDKTNLEEEILFQKLTDEELVKKIVEDNSALLFGELYDRYAKVVYNKCYSFSKSKDEAEDLTQDVFLKLFVKLGSFSGKSKFSTWLYSFTYNFCVNYVNRDKEKKISDNVTELEEDFKQFNAVSDENLFQLKIDKLKLALERIPAEDRKLLLLKYQDDISITELETVMEIGKSAVKMRLKRARSRIIEAYNKIR